MQLNSPSRLPRDPTEDDTLDTKGSCILSRFLRDNLAPTIAFSTGAISALPASMFESENLLATGMIAKRAREFFNGRHHARRALNNLRHPAVPLLRGRAGQVLWPAGFTGSITHSNERCIALAAKIGDFAGLGVDCEAISPRVSDVRTKFLSVPETERYGSADLRRDTRIFSIKEAFFKAYYTGTGESLRLTDMTVALHDADNTFRIAITAGPAISPLRHRQFTGKSAVLLGHAVSTIEIRANEIDGDVKASIERNSV